MTNPENLTHFKPGQSGNPAGRPKGSRNRASILKQLLGMDVSDGRAREYIMNEAIIQKAENGDVAAFKEIQDTLYGKIPDKVLSAETTADEINNDITAEILKDISTEKLEEILKNKNVIEHS